MPSKVDQDLATSYEFDLVGAEKAPFVGYLSSPDRTTVSYRALVKGSKNLFRKLSGTWAARVGLKRWGVPDATIAGVTAEYVWNTSLGKVIPLRVVNYGGANSKLQFESDIVTSGSPIWYDLMTGLSLTRFVFDTWWDNTLKKDQLLFVKGDPKISMWTGGVGKIVSTTINTIVLNAGAQSLGFLSTGGNLSINGNLYSYTGYTASTLTGVAGDPTGEPVGSVVIDQVLTSNLPDASFDNDFIKVINNQLYVGSYNSRFIYISDQTDYTDFTVTSPRLPGSPELLTLDATGKGIGLRNGLAHIFAGTSYLHIVQFQQITVGAVLTEQTTAPREDLADLQSAFAHEFIATVGDSLIYLSQENQVITYGTYRNINQPKYPSLSLAIRDELKDEDFTGGHLVSSDDLIIVTAPLSGISYLHETREKIDGLGNIVAERFWHTPHVWNISRVSIINGIKYGHSNANPQIYQLLDTDQWHDDSPNLSGDGITYENLPYYVVMRMAYRNHGRRQGLTCFDKSFFEGYMTQGTNLNAFVLYEYQGSKGIQNVIINSVQKPAKFFSGTTAPSLGDSSLGDNPLGDGIIDDPNDQELLPKFRAFANLNIVNVFEYQIIVYSNEADSRWEMLCLGTNAQLARNQQATYLNK